MLTHQPSPFQLILPCSHHPSLATQRSPYPPLPFRTRFTNSPKLSPHQESRISPAMHVGAPSFIFAHPFHISSLIASSLRPPLDRQRKVKCNQLPGQPKVCPSPSFPLTNRLCLPSAKYATPLPPPTNSLTLPYSALYGEKLPMHVRSPRLLSPRRRVDVRLFRHHAQQATSEKKRISTVSRRPRTYTASSQHQQRSVSSLSLFCSWATLFVFVSKWPCI